MLAPTFPRLHMEGALKILKLFFFLHLFVAFLKEAHSSRGIFQKPFPYELIAMLSKGLVSKTLLNKIAYGAVPMHIIMHSL